MTTAYVMKLLEAWLNKISQHLAASTLPEWVAAISLPLAAWAISRQINRYIDSKPTHTLPSKAIDFLAPLIAPVLAILFTATAAMAYLQATEQHSILIEFALKLSVAWLAVHVVTILSSGRSAGAFIMLVILPITLLQLFGVWDGVTDFLTKVNFTIGNIKFNLFLIFKAIITLIVMLWVVNFTLATTDNRLRRIRTMRASNRSLVLKFMQIAMYIVVFLFALNMVGVSLTTLSIFSGALGVGIGFGLQKIASNFISGIILLFEKSIEVGDLIELSDGTQGIVKYTSGRYTLISAADGKDVMIPNEEFITQRVNSLTHSNTQGRTDVLVGVDYNDDVKEALNQLIAAAKDSKKCLKDPAPFAIIDSFGDSSINLKLYFWVDNVLDGKLGPRSEVMLNILHRFKQAGISIPYPHQVQMADPVIEERISKLEKALSKPAAKKAE